MREQINSGVKRTVVETEHLTTLFAVVPGHAANDWTTRYETLCDWVVPRSSVSIAKEGDLDLRTVVVFRQVARDFKRAARELRVTVRELSDDDRAVLGIAAVPEEGAAGEEGAKPAAAAGTEPPKDAPSGLSREEERASLADRVDEHWTRLVRWCTLTYQEALQGWMHVKAARAFVESVLRYGLPVNFEAVLVDPGKKGERKVRAVLDEMYGHLGQQDGGEDTGAVDAMAGIAGSDAFYAYVCLTIATSAEDAKTRS
jgi:V-type H+-transporting ATPase subunit C